MMEVDNNNATQNRKRKPLSQLSQTSNDVPVKKSRNVHTEKRAGTITRMILKNFMCHSLLDVEFNNNISIIIGNNGSGKSAIITALVVGLGGKATITNRGSNVKGFIKAGRNSGSVEIELYNGGPMAYRPSIYGNKITIIRNMTASGSSSYKIKNEQGHIVSTLSKELTNITTGLNIQIDNPICILNQDTSRNFLSSKDPKHKFTLFMKATKLDTLAEQYKIAVRNKRNFITVFEDKEKSFKKLHAELKHINQKIQNHKSIAEHRTRMKSLQSELFWAKVRDSEVEFQKEQENHEKLNEELEKLVLKCTNKNDRIAAISKRNTELEQQVNELKECINRHREPQSDLERKIQALSKTMHEKRNAKTAVDNALEDKTKDVEHLQNEITNSNKNKAQAEQQKQEHEQNVAKLDQKIKGIEDHVQTIRNDLFQITNDISRKRDERERFEREISTITAKMRNDESSLNALKNDSGNNLLIYGRDMAAVKQEIAQNQHKFKQVPRGPLGAYVKLRDKKWAVAVEGFLGPGMLSAFAVDNQQDNVLLVNIFKKVWRCGRMPTIITSKFFNKPHNVSKFMVHAPQDCKSLYSVLEIEDPIVSNCFVDQMQIESILLIPNNNRAIELMSDRHQVPRNCNQGITINGDKYYPDPNYRTYGSTYHRAQYLQVDTKQRIEQLQQSLKQLIIEKNNIQTQYSDFNNSLREQDSKKNQLEQTINKLNTAKATLRRQLATLREAPEMEVPDAQILEQELITVGKVILQKKVERQRLEDELKKIKEQVRIEEQTLKTLKQSNRSLDERIQTIVDEIRENKTRQREIETSDSFEKKRIEDMKTKIGRSEAKVKHKQKEVEEGIQQATHLGERVTTKRKVPDIAEDISTLDRLIKQIANQTETVEEVTEKYEMLHGKFKTASDIIKNLEYDIKELNLAIEKRSRHYNLTQDYFVSSMKYSFEKVMEARQFQGSIEINMIEKSLELVVIPQHGSQGLTPTTNLSGGERSFSTVAFLYALWQCMEFPFYILDEFDVYMDKLNRTEVLNILITHAKSRPALQFVFLTPQDVSFVDKTVSILRLEDPERRKNQ